MACTGNEEKAGMEEEGANSSRKTDSEDDLRLLLECLRFQRHCVSAQKQALTTIATMCSNSNSSRILFNSTGGLSYVLDLLFSTKSLEIQQAALYTLGCASENNMINQLKLCKEPLFSFLSELLVTHSNGTSTTQIPDTLVIAVAFLAGCLMSNNVQGQNIARDNGVLSKLITVFKENLPSSTCTVKEHTDGASAVNKSNQTVRLWSSVCSALCTATNNPQNETNQCQCTKLFPAALSVLDIVPLNPDVIRPAISLLASCVANNATAQDRFRLVGGLRSLVSTLKVMVQSHLLSGREQSIGDEEHILELTLHIVKTLSAAAFGHSANCKTLVDLNCVDILLSLLRNHNLDTSTKLNIILCLGMLTEDNCVGQQQLAENEGICLLVDVMANSQSEELSKATTFVLQCCISHQGKPVPEETNLTEKIAQVDKLLRESHSNGSPDSSTSVVCKSICKEALDILDTQKLPMNERVSTWLVNNVPDEPSEGMVSEANDNIFESTKVNQTNETSKHACREERDNEPKRKEQVDHEEARKQALLELQQEKELRVELESKLTKERERRKQLEQELSKRKQKPSTQVPTTSCQNKQNETIACESSNTHTPQRSALGRPNIRYANSASVCPTGIQKLLRQTKTIEKVNQQKHPNTCGGTHSLVDLVYSYENKKREVPHDKMWDSRAKEPTEATTVKTNTVASGPICKQPKICINKLTVCGKTPTTENTSQLKKNSSQKQLHAKLGKTVSSHSLVRDKTLTSELPPTDCGHHCLGCKPRLKCPLITSRNFIKLLRVDRFTCSYHKRLSSRLMGGPGIEVPSSGTFKSPTLYASAPITATSPSETEATSSSLRPATDPDSDNSESTVTSSTTHNEIITTNSMFHNNLSHQHTPSTAKLNDTPTGDPDYLPSASSSYSSHSTEIDHKSPPESGMDCVEITKQDDTHKSACINRPVVPLQYKLIPSSCKASSQLGKILPNREHKRKAKSQAQPLRDVTNEKSSGKKSLSAFDYSTPDGKAKKKYLPKRAAKVAANMKVSGEAKTNSYPKRRIRWTEQEVGYLKEGVHLLGVGEWRHILPAFPFHSSRDGGSLKDKHRNLMKQSSNH